MFFYDSTYALFVFILKNSPADGVYTGSTLSSGAGHLIEAAPRPPVSCGKRGSVGTLGYTQISRLAQILVRPGRNCIYRGIHKRYECVNIPSASCALSESPARSGGNHHFLKSAQREESEQQWIRSFVRCYGRVCGGAETRNTQTLPGPVVLVGIRLVA